MNKFFLNWWKNIDQINIIIITILFLIGIILSFSINISSSIINKHLIYALSSFLLMIIFSFLEIKILRRIALFGLIFFFIILILVLLMNYEIKGSKRWLVFANFSIQPSEFIKPFFLMVSAWFLSKGIQGQKISMYIVFVTFFVIAGLIILQPDLGMTLLLSISFFCQLFIAGLSLLFVFFAIMFLILISVFSYFKFEHVRDRVNNFLDPSADTYQIDWSIKTFKSGGFLGKGPGQGILKEKIPDANTDFIFAVAGEELGYIGSSIIILLILILVVRLLLNLLKIQKPDIIIAIVGLTSCFGLQCLINIFSSLGIIPTKGMTLPLISYGGSSMISSAILFGFLISLTRKREYD